MELSAFQRSEDEEDTAIQRAKILRSRLCGAREEEHWLLQLAFISLLPARRPFFTAREGDWLL